MWKVRAAPRMDPIRNARASDGREDGWQWMGQAKPQKLLRIASLVMPTA